MDMDPKRLSFLLAVARYGSILAAADSLHLTASAVSQQVSRLEKEEGVELLERGPRGVGLTPAGRILVEAAENIERELADARSRLSEAQHGVTGRVVIGAFQTVVSGFLVPILDHLHEALPGLELSIADATSARLPRMLRTGEADLIIVDRDLADTGHTPAHTADVPLLDEPWRLVVPRGSTFDLRGAGLEKLPWLGVAPGGASELPVERAKAALGITPPVVHRYEDFQAALALVQGGLGVTLLPALTVRLGVPEGLDVIDLPGLGSRHLTIRHRSTRREPGAGTRAVVTELVRAAGELDVLGSGD